MHRSATRTDLFHSPRSEKSIGTLFMMEAVENRCMLSFTPTINVSAFDSRALRDLHSPGTFVVTRRDNLSKPLTVPLLLGGTAANGVDYGRVGRSVTIPAGKRSIAIPIRAAASTTMSRYVELAVGKITGYSTSVHSADVSLLNNASSTRPIIQGVRLQETAPLRYVLTRTGGDTATTLTVPISLSGDGINGVDFGTVGNVVTFKPGVTSIPITLRQTSIGAASGRSSTITLVDGSTSIDAGGAVGDGNGTSTGTNPTVGTGAAGGTGTGVGTGSTTGDGTIPGPGTSTSSGPSTGTTGATGTSTGTGAGTTTGTTTGSTGTSSGTTTGTTSGSGTTSGTTTGTSTGTTSPGASGTGTGTSTASGPSTGTTGATGTSTGTGSGTGGTGTTSGSTTGVPIGTNTGTTTSGTGTTAAGTAGTASGSIAGNGTTGSTGSLTAGFSGNTASGGFVGGTGIGGGIFTTIPNDQSVSDTYGQTYAGQVT